MKRLPLFTLLSSMTIVASVSAAPVTWTVQSSSSSMTVSGGITIVTNGEPATDSFFGIGPNDISLTTSYSGTINTDLALGSNGPTGIQILSADLSANNDGNYWPSGPSQSGYAPGNYGLRTSGFSFGLTEHAIRNLSVGLSSGSLSLSGSPLNPQAFLGTVGIDFLSGSIVTVGGGPVGSMIEALGPELFFAGASDSPSTSGSITYANGLAILTIPIDVAVNLAYDVSSEPALAGSQMEFNFVGSIVATTPIESVPEAGSLILIGSVVCAVGFVGYRRNRQS